MGSNVQIKAIFLCLPFAFAHPAAAQLKAVDGLAALDAGDAATARAIWTPLAQRGDVLAQYNLAVLKLTGQGGAENTDAANSLLEAAAQQGYLPAQRMLAGLASERRDWRSARQWYLTLAKAGEASAQAVLASLLERGLGGAADHEGAVSWYRKAAAQEHLHAQFSLAVILAERGDISEAADWFEAAAAQGDALAMHNLAGLLAQGSGRAQDEAAARGWYLRAAQSGYAPAMRNLALMQARGRGGAQSFRFALAWALNAYALDGSGTADLVEALREVMSDAAIAEAEALVADCLHGSVDCG